MQHIVDMLWSLSNIYCLYLQVRFRFKQARIILTPHIKPQKLLFSYFFFFFWSYKLNISDITLKQTDWSNCCNSLHHMKVSLIGPNLYTIYTMLVSLHTPMLLCTCITSYCYKYPLFTFQKLQNFKNNSAFRTLEIPEIPYIWNFRIPEILRIFISWCS